MSEEIKQYRKKPIVIEAMKLVRDHEIAERAKSWCAGEPVFEGLEIKTLEGIMLARFGDFIIRGIKGEFYPCKPDIFYATYEEVEKPQ